jgi:hypothetical protein
MSERLTKKQLHSRVTKLEAALASAYREIKRLQQKFKEAGLVVGYGPDTPIFDE